MRNKRVALVSWWICVTIIVDELLPRSHYRIFFIYHVLWKNNCLWTVSCHDCHRSHARETASFAAKKHVNG